MSAQYYQHEKDIYNNEQNSYNQPLSMLEEKISDVSQKNGYCQIGKAKQAN